MFATFNFLLELGVDEILNIFLLLRRQRLDLLLKNGLLKGYKGELRIMPDEEVLVFCDHGFVASDIEFPVLVKTTVEV